MRLKKSYLQYDTRVFLRCNKFLSLKKLVLLANVTHTLSLSVSFFFTSHTYPHSCFTQWHIGGIKQSTYSSTHQAGLWSQLPVAPPIHCTWCCSCWFSFTHKKKLQAKKRCESPNKFIGNKNSFLTSWVTSGLQEPAWRWWISWRYWYSSPLSLPFS